MGCDFTQVCQEAVDLNQRRSRFNPMMSGSQLLSGKLELTFTPPSPSLCHQKPDFLKSLLIFMIGFVIHTFYPELFFNFYFIYMYI